MNSKIKKVLRESFFARMQPRLRLESEDFHGAFVDTYEWESSALLDATVILVGSKNSDTFQVNLCWDLKNRPYRARADFVSLMDLGEMANSLESVSKCEFNIGLLIDGRPRTYHLLRDLEADAPASIERLYSTGDGPEYRIKRISAAIELISRQLIDHWVPYIEGVRAYAIARKKHGPK